MIKVGSIVVPKKEFLDPGETQRPCVVVDIWNDKEVGEKMVVMDCEDVAKNKKDPSHPVYKFYTLSRYYEEI